MIFTCFLHIILTLYKITNILPLTTFLNKEISKLIPKIGKKIEIYCSNKA